MIKPWTVKQSFYIHLLVESAQNINNTRQQQHAWITCAQSPARDLQKKCTAYFSTFHFLLYCELMSCFRFSRHMISTACVLPALPAGSGSTPPYCLNVSESYRTSARLSWSWTSRRQRRSGTSARLQIYWLLLTRDLLIAGIHMFGV